MREYANRGRILRGQFRLPEDHDASCAPDVGASIVQAARFGTLDSAQVTRSLYQQRDSAEEERRGLIERHLASRWGLHQQMIDWLPLGKKIRKRGGMDLVLPFCCRHLKNACAAVEVHPISGIPGSLVLTDQAEFPDAGRALEAARVHVRQFWLSRAPELAGEEGEWPVLVRIFIASEDWRGMLSNLKDAALGFLKEEVPACYGVRVRTSLPFVPIPREPDCEYITLTDELDPSKLVNSFCCVGVRRGKIVHLVVRPGAVPSDIRKLLQLAKAPSA